MMEIKYVYVKTRVKFGKQCFFEDDTSNVVDINPEPALMENYVPKNLVRAEAQNAQRFALHECQTESTAMKNSGMLHQEGGWPKEMNFRDEEATARFKRRVEKDDIWAPKMHGLAEPAEKKVLQNNVVNIYETFFEDAEPSSLQMPLDVRTVSTYADPQEKPRPVTHVSWSPDYGTRMAVSYCFPDVQRDRVNGNLYSYIWEIENPNTAYMALKAFASSVTIEYNPRDPSVLISGLVSGQICSWDVRTGTSPVALSHPLHSHKQPATSALWINSKTHSELFSASSDGCAMWWDVRNLQRPTEKLIMDLEDPTRADESKAIGVSSLNFEPTMGTKFMTGMENGLVISGNRRGQNEQQKLALRFECHDGPVLATARNSFSPKNFLTVGTWSAKIWAEDTKEGHLVSTFLDERALTSGCWSTSRYSVFYIITASGDLEVFDLLASVQSPVRTLNLCSGALRAVAPHGEGKLVAVGGDNGIVYLVESSEALVTNVKHEKASMVSYLDQCSRFEKAIDSRMKEIRLAQHTTQKQEVGKSPRRKADKIERKKEDKVKGRKEGKTGAIEKEKKRPRIRRARLITDDPELSNVETGFYDAIRKEIEKYAAFGDDGTKTAAMETRRVKVKIDERDKKEAKNERDRRSKGRRGEKKGKKERPSEIVIVRKKAEPSEMEREQLRVTSDSNRTEENVVASEKSLGEKVAKLLPEVNPCEGAICEPGICCSDVSGEGELLNYHLPGEFEGKRIAQPDIMRHELAEAREGLREWRERIIAGKAGAAVKPRKEIEMETSMEAASNEKRVKDREDIQEATFSPEDPGDDYPRISAAAFDVARVRRALREGNKIPK